MVNTEDRRTNAMFARIHKEQIDRIINKGIFEVVLTTEKAEDRTTFFLQDTPGLVLVSVRDLEFGEEKRIVPLWTIQLKDNSKDTLLSVSGIAKAPGTIIRQ